jgi:hypothetical protein
MLNQVFISYRRENDAHVGRVRSLAEQLRQRGVVVSFDEFYLAANPAGPDEKWSRWCINQAKESSIVLIVGSQGWYAAFSDPGSAPSTEGLGAAAEANIIQEQLYQAKWVTGRHRVVLLDAADAQGLPVEISGWKRFAPLSNSADMESLALWVAQRTGSTPPASSGPVHDWPDQAPPLFWPMADHAEVREAFKVLLTRGAPWRFLVVRGPSETGKSHITKQILGNSLQMPDLSCGRFDFKGTSGMDSEVRSFVQYLGVPQPPASQLLNDRLSYILEALKRAAQPTVLVFDAYEYAGEAQEWVEKQLLSSLVRERWLRVVIAGQRVPEVTNAAWAIVARAPLTVKAPPPEEWLAFGQPNRPDITLEFVRQAHQYCGGKASVMAQLCGPANAT